jgi:hypothetical protein
MKTQVPGRKSCPSTTSVHHKIHKNWPGIKSRPQVREAERMEVYLHAPSVFMCEDLQNQFHKNCRLILCNYMSLKRTVVSSKNIHVSLSEDQLISVSKMQSKNLQLGYCFNPAMQSQTSYCFTIEASCFTRQNPLENFMHPCWFRLRSRSLTISYLWLSTTLMPFRCKRKKKAYILFCPNFVQPILHTRCFQLIMSLHKQT